MRKIVCVVLSLMLLTSVVVLTVSANNHQDTSFFFNFTTLERNTEDRQKRDASSSYMKCTRTGATYWGKVYEINYGNSSVRIETDRSHGYKYAFNTGTVHFMYNWVWEETTLPTEQGEGWQPWAFIKATSGATVYTAEGVWSPDSVPE